jgi:hypothetical protein
MLRVNRKYTIVEGLFNSLLTILQLPAIDGVPRVARFLAYSCGTKFNNKRGGTRLKSFFGDLV